MARRVGLITSGGDAPGMNAAVRAVTRYGISLGYEIIGIRRGFRGLLDDDFETLSLRSVSGIINDGGTILHTGRCPEMKTKTGMNRAVKTVKQLGLEGIVVVGGDGSLAAASAISRHGIKVMAIPASIDNDVFGTDETIGYDTAMNTAVEAIDKIRDTATSHDRIFVVEIMGREHGFLTLEVGIAAGCEFVIIPEVKYDINKIAGELRKGKERGKTSEIIAFAEGSGSSIDFAKKIEKLTGLEVRVSNLGYIQRGGRPTARTRILGSKFGYAAMHLFHNKKYNHFIGITDGKISSAPISKIINKNKKINSVELKLLRKLSI